MTTNIILGLLLGATLLGQLVQIHIGGLDIAPLDLAVLVTVVWGGLEIYRTKALHSLHKLPQVRALMPFALAVIASLLLALPALDFSFQAIVISGLYAARLIGYLLVGVVLVYKFRSQPKFNQSPIIVWSGIIFVAAGLIELALFPDFQIYDHLGWDPHKHRLISTFLDPNFASIWMAAVLALAIAGISQAGKILQKTWAVVASFILLAGTLGTLSRSGLLALAGVFCVLGLIYFKKWFWLGAALVIALVIAVPPLNHRLMGAINLDTTVRYRLESWEGAANIIRHHPVLGVGYNTLKFRRYEMALPGTSKLVSRFEDGLIRTTQLTSRADAGFDSSLLTIAATTGLLGLLLFLWWLWISLSLAWQAIRNGNYIYSSWFVAFTAGLILSSWFVNAWLYPPILILWLIAWALSVNEQPND